MAHALKTAAGGALAAAIAAPSALAQYYPAPGYQEDLREHRYEQQQYEAHRAAYDAARREYERRLADYDRARADYDRRHGYGTYARRYGPPPAWDERSWTRTYGRDRGYDRAYGDGPYQPNAYDYAQDAVYAGAYAECPDRTGRAPAAGVLGEVAGASLGPVAARNAHLEDTVLGGLAGGASGDGIPRASAQARCDARGWYYSYDQTVPYREAPYDGGRRGRPYAATHGCRLAAAPVEDRGWVERRWVRVCPDPMGRFRITG